MKYIILPWIIVCCINLTSAQDKHDNTWVFANLNIGGNILDFNADTLFISALGSTSGRAREALACMSDNEGNLLFYTNNCTVFNKNHQIMENGEGLNPGQIQTYWCSVNPYANPTDNSVIILPNPDNAFLYQILHWDYEAFNIGQPGGTLFGPLHLYNTVVDMSQNNGLGKVVTKNNLIIEDTMHINALQAVRHANGRDWWILAPEFNGNCYHKILLTPTGPQIVGKQCIGSNWGKYGLGSTHFTTDGSKYVRSTTEYGLNIFDFDRCSGQLSNPIHIPIDPTGTFPINCTTLSQSGRFAYYHTLKQIYQYDLEAQDIAGSKTLVATYDGFQSVNNTDFYKSQLAPDGKIYINSFGPVYYLHVIEYPDSVGLACQVKQHAIELPNYHFAAMPNFPNYRLYDLPASPCDTLGIDAPVSAVNPWPISLLQEVSLYPNPATERATLYLPGWQGAGRMTVTDALGRVWLEQPVHRDRTTFQVDHWPAGVYSVSVWKGERLAGVELLLKGE